MKAEPGNRPPGGWLEAGRQLGGLLAPHRWLLIGGVLLLALNRASTLVLPGSIKFLVDDLIGLRRGDLWQPFAAVVGTGIVVQAATSLVLVRVFPHTAKHLVKRLQTRLHAHVLRLPLAYHDNVKVGSLVSRIMYEVQSIGTFVGSGLVDLVGGVVTAGIILILIARLSLPITGVMLATVGLLVLVLSRVLRRLRPLFREHARVSSEVKGRLTESLGGIRVVKGYHAEGREHLVVAEGVSRMVRAELATLRLTSLMSVSARALVAVAGVVVMYVGTLQIHAGELTVGGFSTCAVLLGFLIFPVFQVVTATTKFAEVASALERMREILAEPLEEDDARRTVAVGALRGEVVFEDVHFAYAPGQVVLGGLSFRALPGTMTALVGPSGAGKSTVLGLIAAFRAPNSGLVTVDGHDLRQLRLDAYRTQLGLVLQETFLFDGTIRENVAFSRPNATDNEILGACRAAHVDHFVADLPHGYDTLVGERGLMLSAGQRQRVSIARAILADPRILVLDEATSNLDAESEFFIQEALAFLMRGRTTFVAAHRLSTIRGADQILVLEAGQIVERGSHSSLYAQRGRYFDFYSRQQEHLRTDSASISGGA